MAQKQFVDSTMLIEREGGPIELEITGAVHYTVDRRYGEDADGNRGSCKTFVHEVLNIVATDGQLDTVDLSPSEVEQAADILTKKFLEG